MNLIKKLKEICRSCDNESCQCKSCIGKAKICKYGDCGLMESIEGLTKCKNDHKKV